MSKMNFFTFLFLLHVFHGLAEPCEVCTSPNKRHDAERRMKRQSKDFAERGEKFGTFAKEFVTMFGEDGLKVKSVMGIAGKLGPLLGPVGSVFSIIGLFADSGPSLQDIKDTIDKGFKEIHKQLDKVHIKLDRIYKLLLQSSQFQMIEQETSFLNGLEDAINQTIEFPEEYTRDALCRYCRQTSKAPVDILRRLNEYVHKDALPPKLKDALFSLAQGSASQIGVVTKQILADVIRAVLFKQTCLGVQGASDRLKNKTAEEDQKTFQNLANTFLEWEQSLVPPFALNGQLKQAEAKVFSYTIVEGQGGGWDPGSGTEKFQKYLRNVVHRYIMYYMTENILKKSPVQPGDFPINLALTVIQKDSKNKIDILNPNRAAIFDGTLRGQAVQLLVTWSGYKEKQSVHFDRLRANKKKLVSLFQPVVQTMKDDKGNILVHSDGICKKTETTITKMTRQFNELLMDIDAAATAVFPKDIPIARTWTDIEKGDNGQVFLAHDCNLYNDGNSGVLVML